MQNSKISIFCVLLVTQLIAVIYWNDFQDKLANAISGIKSYLDHYESLLSTNAESGDWNSSVELTRLPQRLQHEDGETSSRIKIYNKSLDTRQVVEEVHEHGILFSQGVLESIRPESVNVNINKINHTTIAERREECSSYETYAESRARHKDKLSRDWVYKMNDAPKTILLWNAFFTQEDFGVGLGGHFFASCGCLVQCELTRDETQLQTADAIVVHTFFLQAENTVLPTRTRADQLFVFFLLESPLVAKDGMMDYDYNDVFNLTMTYLDDPLTDIYAPVGDFIRVPSEATALPNLHTVKLKKRFVAWLVSNCDPASARNEYVTELSKYIKVDIFGKCGNLSCSERGDYDECMTYISENYLFYLSFENSYCEGYITEKVYRTLQFDIVPIVYGGGNFSLNLPSKSYIDVRDFQSPKHLVGYLSQLSHNRAEYLEYFQWRRKWAVRGDYQHRARGFCKLCNILHWDSYPYKTNFDLLNYWSPARLCSTRTDEMARVHLL